MIRFTHRGNFNNTEKFLKKSNIDYIKIFEKYGRQGVIELSKATPIDSGETAKSWEYKITQTKFGIKLEWTNSHVEGGAPVAILIQYGHGTRNGGYVQGRDYINPVIKPILDKLSSDIWREVTKP